MSPGVFFISEVDGAKEILELLQFLLILLDGLVNDLRAGQHFLRNEDRRVGSERERDGV
jgi:hypothetical protein